MNPRPAVYETAALPLSYFSIFFIGSISPSSRSELIQNLFSGQPLEQPLATNKKRTSERLPTFEHLCVSPLRVKNRFDFSGSRLFMFTTNIQRDVSICKKIKIVSVCVRRTSASYLRTHVLNLPIIFFEIPSRCIESLSEKSA